MQQLPEMGTVVRRRDALRILAGILADWWLPRRVLA